ncbi:sulfotransferase domain-containing protein [Paraburkholderia sp. 40]|uniref:sulfotransferase domain-containing protein n=1 Tax=Paraburkholderia sp. 40 TaxID=2991059 RepID=UPI003D224F05
MAISNIFIAGMDKCGTTALSQWMVDNDLAEDRVPGIKEPALYVNDEPHPGKFRVSAGRPLLDATVAYSKSADYVRLLPEHETRIVICWRNQLDRSWSLYKMLKVFERSGAELDSYFHSFWKRVGAEEFRRQTFFEVIEHYFPRRLHDVFRRYVEKEMEHIRTHSFVERVEYEMSFYLSRQQWPFCSVLAGGFYYRPIRMLLEKYLPQDIAVISVNQLADQDRRRHFVREVFEKEIETPDVPLSFSNENIELEEPKPDFHDRKFDTLRACFRYDLEQARELVKTTLFGDSLLDHAGLDRYFTEQTT